MPRTNLRPPASSFVGRRDALDAIARLFEEGRLVTILGPGGMGKTRLSLRFAEERLGTYARRGGGVWIVELHAARSASDLLATTAATLGVSLAGAGDEAAMIATLGRGLARLGRTLVVLDNVEQIAAAAAPVVEAWISLAPAARLLVTSRVALGSPAERVHVLEPLALDEATELFLGRARAVGTWEARDDEDGRRVAAEIVEAIDRMPLAIELAASRTRALSPDELRARADRPLAWLGGGRDRHASVREVVLASHALLTPTAARAFALVSVARNGFSLPVAEEILSVAMPRGEVLGAIDALVRGSLLRATQRRGAPTRYALFETLRDVAEELDDPARDAARAAHARYYARTARTMSSELAAQDLENLLLAHETSVRLACAEASAADARGAVDVARVIDPVLSARGLSRRREALATATLAALDAAGPHGEELDLLRAEVRLGRGRARRELGEAAAAREDVDAALVLGASDPGLSAVARISWGGLLDLAGDTARARAQLEEALALLRATPDGALRSRREAEALLRLGHTHRREGALDAARTAIVAAAERHRALGDDEGLASSLYELAVIEMFASHTREALAAFDEGKEVARRGGMRVLEGAHTTGRGCLLQDQDALDEAITHHATAAQIFRELGSRSREVSALYYLATAHLERGAATEARLVLDDARTRSAGVGAPRYDALISGAEAITLATLGRMDEARGELARAERALSQVAHEPALATVLATHRLTLAVHEGTRTVSDALSEITPRAQATPSDDTRFAVRMLGRARGSIAPSDVLTVWGPGAAFRVPAGTRVTLPARSPMRRILDRLTTARLERPGEAVSVDALIAAGWPGEKIGEASALNRLYVALATLRKRGLRGVIVSTEGGYALSRAVLVARAPLEGSAD